jgi:ABC-type multidrug transport system permease subunit
MPSTNSSLTLTSILVAPDALPGFWIFMHRVSPLTYFLEALAIAGISGVKVDCSNIELLKIPMPSGQSDCGQYLAEYMKTATGTLMNAGSGASDCMYCPVSEADVVLQTLGMGTDKARGWRNLGIMGGFILFDVVAIFGIYYLARVPRKPKGKK